MLTVNVSSDSSTLSSVVLTVKVLLSWSSTVKVNFVAGMAV